MWFNFTIKCQQVLSQATAIKIADPKLISPAEKSEQNNEASPFQEVSQVGPDCSCDDFGQCWLWWVVQKQLRAMNAKVEEKLVEMERKYLKKALERCILCYEMSTAEDCSARCVDQYFGFMKLKEFYIKKNVSKITAKELGKLEGILDSIQ